MSMTALLEYLIDYHVTADYLQIWNAQTMIKY